MGLELKQDRPHLGNCEAGRGIYEVHCAVVSHRLEPFIVEHFVMEHALSWYERGRIDLCKEGL